MPTLHIEHAISDFGVWKNAFEADPARREESGVRRYRVFRPLDDPRYVAIDLDFDSVADARRSERRCSIYGARAAPRRPSPARRRPGSSRRS